MSGQDRNPELVCVSPVDLTDTGSVHPKPVPGLALCLSGGGYRAMLFHLGALWRLNELGYLTRLDRVSSVSGGSVAAGVMGLKWSRLSFDAKGVAGSFVDEVVRPVRSLACKTIDWMAMLSGLWFWAGSRLAQTYRRHLFGSATLQELPDRPRFVINATNLQSGVLWRFMKPYMRDYRVGEVKLPRLPLAVAVAASSAFPPFLSPVRLRLPETAYTPGSGRDLQRPPFTTRVVLTDGGVYDNLGLETAWKRYDTILVSDAGGQMKAEARPWCDWLLQTRRVLLLIENQVGALRKRQVIGAFKRWAELVRRGTAETDEAWRSVARKGAYWGIRSNIEHYGLEDALRCPNPKTLEIAALATRLKRLDRRTQERLVNWGYAVCDAAMRRHVEPGLPAPVGFPYQGGVQ